VTQISYPPNAEQLRPLSSRLPLLL